MNIALYCKTGQGFGFGHLSRSLTLINLIKKYYPLILIINENKAKLNLKEDISVYSLNSEKELAVLLISKKIELLILDIRDTEKNFILSLKKITKVLSIDDLGKGSAYSDITIHMLPTPSSSQTVSNFSGIDYLILKRELYHYKKNRQRDKLITITFGGEDYASLTEQVYEAIKKIKIFLPEYHFQIVLGPLFNRKSQFEEVTILRNPKDFYEVLAESEIIITSFGLTVFEALFLDKKVITVNASDYHDNLAQQVEGIINLGSRTELPNLKLFKLLKYTIQEKNLQKAIKRYSKSCEEGIEKKYGKPPLSAPKNILGIIQTMENVQQDLCPICSALPKTIYRKGYINYYHCESCKSFFRSKNYEYTEDYNDDYFTTQYLNQYGKTYLEDKSNINRFNSMRINIIKKLCPPDKYPNLLEIGSAMGFFLEMARDNGYQTTGIEISKYASEYSMDSLKLDIIDHSFDKNTKLNEKYDIISAWFFIEHHIQFIEVLDNMISHLKPGGLIALSTPNAYGISYRNSPVDYVQRIPADHYIEYSPQSLALVLEKRGFKIEHIEMKGLHPSRLLKQYSFGEKLNKPFINFLVKYWMKFKQLGDTFEIYAKKVN